LNHGAGQGHRPHLPPIGKRDELVGTQLTLHIYDCNNPGRDDITIVLDVSSPTPAKTIATNGTSGPSNGRVRGFFRLPYTHADPSAAYIDDAVATTLVAPPPRMTSGEQASVAVAARASTWSTR
jgi:hypothetical protein